MMRFLKRMQTWPDALERAGADAARQAAQQGAELARQYAPVDSGELRSGIGVRRDGNGAAVNSAAPHAAMLEYGTSRMAAQPYMLPMAEEMRGRFAEIAADAVKEVFA